MIRERPHVVVCAGGGGVGKTTTSAALALALARAGARTLIVTIDPARRLAGAMGFAISDALSEVPIAAAEGRLHALMPDPRRSLGVFIDHLFEDEPDGRDRLRNNGLYIAMSDAAAGVHELVAMNLVARASREGDFDVIVIDTAPSRHAIDFVTYPGRLAALLGGRTVSWLAGLADRAAGPRRSAGALSWGAGRVESLLGRVTGPHLVRDTAALFSELATVRERFVALTGRASELLLGERAAYVLVAAPAAAARDDVLYLDERLGKLGRRPRAVVLNRADTDASVDVQALLGAPHLPPSIADALTVLEHERQSRTAAADTIAAELRAALPRVPVLRLPHLEARSPEAIVMALCDGVAPYLKVLVPGWG